MFRPIDIELCTAAPLLAAAMLPGPPGYDGKILLCEPLGYLDSLLVVMVIGIGSG